MIDASEAMLVLSLFVPFNMGKNWYGTEHDKRKRRRQREHALSFVFHQTKFNFSLDTIIFPI